MRELGSYWVVKQFVPAEQPANTVFKQAWHGNVVLLYIAHGVPSNALDAGAAGGAGARNNAGGGAALNAETARNANDADAEAASNPPTTSTTATQSGNE